jgi:hypothetical protein
VKAKYNVDRLIGLGFVVLALIIIIIWIPLDVETGILEKARRRIEIGDAMAPTLAACIMLVAGLLLAFRPPANSGAELTAANLLFLFKSLLCLLIAFCIMRWTGPLAVDGLSLIGAELPGYRQLRDSPPWKYLGFLIGGTTLVSSLVCLIERRFVFKSVIVGVGISLFLIIVYDLPFDDLLLPPNGDV